MMRVLGVIDSLGAGGAERSLAESILPLRARGIEVEVAYFKATGDGVEAQVRSSTEAFLLQGSRAARIRELRHLIRQRKPDLVHTVLFESDVAGRIAALGTGVPVLTSLVNTSYDAARLDDPGIRRWRLEVVRAIDAITARVGTHHFHAITNVVADSAVTRLHVRAPDVTVAYRGRDRGRLGVRSDDRRRQARRSLGIDDATPLVLAVGRQEYQKGQATVIGAASVLRDKHPDVQIVIAGREGAATTDLRTRIEAAELGNTVHLLGHRDDVADLIVAADVFVFPSFYEGLGGALIEAMALGAPVVTSDLPVTREVAGDAAVYVRAGDADELATEVCALIDDPAERERLGDLGIDRFESTFGFEPAMDALAAVIERTMQPGSR